MNYKQNEKIEQVKPCALVVGIDIGSETHFARAVLEFCKRRCCILCVETGKQPEIQESDVSQVSSMNHSS